jgi:hypothetical protein
VKVFEGSQYRSFVVKDNMSKYLMKLRLHKDINRHIQKDNYELRMKLQSLEKEKQKLQDQLICHEEFHRGIFHELERKLQTKDQILAPFHEVGQVENGKYPTQEKLAPSKGIIEKDDSSYSSFPRQDGECSRMTEVRGTSDEEVLHKQLVLPSILGKGSICKTSPGRDGHSEGRVKTFPTGKIGIWSTYPCASCGTSNHNMVKCRRRQSMQEKPSKKKAKGKNHFLRQKKRGNDQKGSWFQDRNKTLCSYCGKSVH